ncbi:MAG: extracellular solute-binding protein [Bacteroidota bacterium]
MTRIPMNRLLIFVSAFCISVLLISGFVSCKKEKKDESVTLTFTSWRTDDVDQMDRINALYTKAHPNIHIKFQPYPTETYDSISHDRYAKGIGADLIFLRPYEVGRKFYDQSYLYDLSNTIPNLSSFSPVVVHAWSTDQGITYGLPSVGVTHGIYYQKAIFDKYGLSEPTNWTEFMAVCQTLKQGGENVIAQGVTDSWTMYEVVFSGLGANFYGGEPARQGLMAGTMKLTDDNFLAAFAMVNSLKPFLAPGYETKSYEEMRQLFGSGNAAMFIGGSWEISVFNNLGATSDKIGWFAPPVAVTGANLQYCFHVDGGIGVNKNSKNLSAALEYLKWLSGSEYAQALMSELPGFFSYTPGSYAISNPLAKEMYDASAGANLTVRTMCEKLSAQEPAGNTLMGTALNGMMLGTYTPATAAAYVQSQLDTWYHP